MADKKFCPYIKGDCKGPKCIKWIKLQGTHPQTGQTIDQEGCADAWLPILLTDISLQLLRLQASVQSHRNEEIERLEKINTAMTVGARAVGRMQQIFAVAAKYLQPLPAASLVTVEPDTEKELSDD
jgi:hypothetical protein